MPFDALKFFCTGVRSGAVYEQVIDDLSLNSSSARIAEEMIAKTICRHAVKANHPLDYFEVEKQI
jgi:hypothetical protein